MCSNDDLDDTADRLTKLAYQDVRKSQALKDALAEHYYSQFPFSPEINPKSRLIGKVCDCVTCNHVTPGLSTPCHTRRCILALAPKVSL